MWRWQKFQTNNRCCRSAPKPGSIAEHTSERFSSVERHTKRLHQVIHSPSGVLTWMKWLLAWTYRQSWWNVAGRGRGVYWKWHCWSSLWVIRLVGNGEERRVRASPGPQQMWRLLYLPGPIRRSCSKNKAPGLPFYSEEMGSCFIPVKFKWDTCLLPASPHKWAPA